MKEFQPGRGALRSSQTETAIRLMAIKPASHRVAWRGGSHKRHIRYWLWLAAGPLAWFFQQIAANAPTLVETWYARGFYPPVVGAWSRLTGLLPFSLMEMLIILMTLLTPILLFFWIRGIVRAPARTKLRSVLHPLGHLLVIISIWYALSVPMWNLHYSRPTFLTLSGMQAVPSDTQTLADATLWLAREANAARESVVEDASGQMILQNGAKKAFVKSSSGYDVLSERFPFLTGSYGRPKPVLLSRFMSWTRIIGLYTVTTAEANIDVDMPAVEIPFTALHEMAHQRGIAREDEANAVAWFASRVHPDPEHRYSGAVQAYLYASNALYGSDPNAWAAIREQLSPGVLRDLAGQAAYWRQFDSVVDRVAEKANDVWLKSNGETDGVKSYGRMVDLMLVEYKRLVAEGLVSPPSSVE